MENRTELTWIGDAKKAFAFGPAGLVGVRTGTEIVTFEEVTNRLQQGEKGDDVPIVMSFFGVDYDEACDAVFSNRFQQALELMRDAQSVGRRQREEMLLALQGLCDDYGKSGLISIGSKVFKAYELLPIKATDDPVECELRKVCDAFTKGLIEFGAAVFKADEFLGSPRFQCNK